MIVRVAVVPNPPLLVPELVTGAEEETEPVRAACLAAVADLSRHSRRWLAVCAARRDAPAVIGSNAVGTFRGFGVDVAVRLSKGADGEPDPRMPLPALVAGWLLERVGAEEVEVRTVPVDAPTERCREAGERLAAECAGDEPLGLLVLGDGSHRHGDRAPGRPDDRAAAFDERVRVALAEADASALLGLDAGLAGELGADGRAAWQVLAGVAGATGTAWRCVTSRLMVPFGVAYHVAVWEPR